jgi:hypothetical protein
VDVAVSTSRVQRAILQLRHRYYRTLAPTRGTRPRTAADPSFDLDGWVAAVAADEAPTRVVVLASGPSAATYQALGGDLVVATNSSQELARSLPYVYFLTEGYHVDRYLKLGPASTTCRGVFFRIASEGRPDIQAEVSRRILGYARSSVRDVPELFAADLHDHGLERENFDGFEAAIRAITGVPIRQYNSGFGATYLGLFLAARFGASLHLYGLDAGVGGHTHFDGSSMQSPSVVGDRVRSKLADLHQLLAEQSQVEVENCSAFRPPTAAG